jgi:membrane protein implicated in regulation of membrane protease activity
VGHEDAGGGGIFSIKPLTGFFLGFGWVGGLALDADLPGWAALGAALLAGATFMAGVVLMFRAILSMRSDGTARIADTVGAVGTVYVSLPPGRVAGGQVTVSFKGRQETYAALAASEAAIPSGMKVRVVGVIDNQTLRVETI